MNQTNPDYTFGTASLEIILLSLGAFLLGMLLCWLLRKMGICCRSQVKDESQPDHSPMSISARMGENDRGKREFPAAPNAGSYTADLNHLLRDPSTPASTTSPSSQTVGTVSTGITAASTVASATLLSSNAHTQKDDLKKLEGIGPKIEQLLNAAGIQSYYQLAAMSADDIKPILEAAGNQFKMHDPKSWPYQAELASKDDWNRLKEYQNLLVNGSIE